MTAANQIWIELDDPRPHASTDPDKADIAHNRRQCELANKLLRRLGVDPSRSFWYSEDLHTYCYGGDHGYKVLSDNGAWFNLDSLAGETTE